MYFLDGRRDRRRDASTRAMGADHKLLPLHMRPARRRGPRRYPARRAGGCQPRLVGGAL